MSNSEAALIYPSLHIKREPEDWRVYEQNAMRFDGTGEHVYFYVEKRALNTNDLVALLAKACGVQPQHIGFAGLKDKHALTRQWFSVPSASDRWPLDVPGVRCLDVRRHAKKLRRGMHAGNKFELRLRDISGAGLTELRQLDGLFANFFGPQRLSASNVQQARAWLARHYSGQTRPGRRRRAPASRRGWHLSVLRSLLFNAVLTRRRQLDLHTRLIAGDVPLDGLPSAPLWGRGRSETQDRAACIEQAALAEFPDVCDGLEHAGVTQARRVLAARPQHFELQQLGPSDVQVSFSLPPGVYATVLLADRFNVVDDSSKHG